MICESINLYISSDSDSNVEMMAVSLDSALRNESEPVFQLDPRLPVQGYTKEILEYVERGWDVFQQWARNTSSRKSGLAKLSFESRKFLKHQVE